MKNLACSVIEQAFTDAISKDIMYDNKYRINLRKEARRFIRSRRLEDWIEKFNLDLSPYAIRKALKIAENKKDFVLTKKVNCFKIS